MKPLTMTFQTLPAALALAVGALCAVCAVPVAAQTGAALVQSVDEPGRNPYQEVQFNGGCRGTMVCSFVFAPVPDGKRLVVTYISGYIDTSSGSPPNGFFKSAFGGSAYADVHFTGVRRPSGALGTRYFINQQVLTYFGLGETPVATMQMFGDLASGGASLMVSGYFVNAP